PTPTMSSRPSPLSLHDALPISGALAAKSGEDVAALGGLRALLPQTWQPSFRCARFPANSKPRRKLLMKRHLWLVLFAAGAFACRDRKSTRLNSSHLGISYAVFC